MLSVVGMVYNGLHGLTHGQLQDKFMYAEVTLVAEPENPYDSEAVAVYVGGHKVGHIPRRETHHVHNGNLCALKWGVASVGRNAYQSIYMTLEPWADAVRRRMCTFERGDVLELRTPQMDMMRDEFTNGVDDKERFLELFQLTGSKDDLLTVGEIKREVSQARLAVTSRKYNRWIKSTPGCELTRAIVEGKQQRVAVGIKRKREVGAEFF